MKNIQVSEYGITAKGETVKKYTLINKNGMQAEIIDYGGIILSLRTPDRKGKYQNVVLGFDRAEDYFEGNPYYFGAVIGRFGNRIAKGEFMLEGLIYQLDKNDGGQTLHGGEDGFHTRFWNSDYESCSNVPTLKLTYISPDGEGGFPGKLTTCICYTLTDDDALEIYYKAETDQTTVVNLTNHSYFNLSGDFGKMITDHQLQINADRYLPVNSKLIPTGEQESVIGTPFDFRILKSIGKEIDSPDEQLIIGNGYDHNWVTNGKGLRNIARLYHEESGRILDVISDQPGVQFYSGNFLDGSFETEKDGRNNFRSGLCLETQHFPDSPNQSAFPSTILEKGQKYQSKTIYKFSVK